MNARRRPLLVGLSLLAALAGTTTTVRAQESVRNLQGPGQHNAFLTHNQVDRWIFDGEKGETIVAHVVSREFDPILELVKSGEKDDEKELIQVDDPGNESRFSFRLPDQGRYKIRVHAYKFQGGGNYTLGVQRFQARPLDIGKALLGSFDRAGKGYLYFQAVKDQILIPNLKGGSAQAWKLLDRQGRELPNWAGSVHIEEPGECTLIVSGSPQHRYDLLLREARQKNLIQAKDATSKVDQGEMDVWNFVGKPGDFRLLEVDTKGQLQSRLVYAPVDKKDEQRIKGGNPRPEIEYLPVASRGGRARIAAILGRAGRYQLQLKAETTASYNLSARDPSIAIAWGKDAAGALPVGGSAFYSFKVMPGQLLEATIGSKSFAPQARLYDDQGRMVDASGEGLDARITHMVLSEGLYRLQVSSIGDGGGGDYRLALRETPLKELEIGGRAKTSIEPGATDFWVFAGQEGKTVFFSVRSAAFDPSVSLRSPDGVQLAADNRGTTSTGSLFAVTLPKTGRYTLWVASQRGAGEYSVRLIDGD